MILNDALTYTINQLTTLNIRHEIHRFDSGCVMIDIWQGNKFYCLQFEEEKVGFSVVTKDIDFSTIPDKWCTNLVELNTELKSILQIT